jgi:hypothetical protein
MHHRPGNPLKIVGLTVALAALLSGAGRSENASAIRASAGPRAVARAGAAPAQDGFTGWEKEITNVTGGGEPEIAVGPTGSPLLVAFNGCGIAVSPDRGASFAVSAKNPADPGPTPGDPYHSCSDPAAAIGSHNVLYTGAGYWDQPAGAVDYYNMFVSHSGDGGQSWSKPVFATGDMAAPQQLLLGRNSGHTDRMFVTADTSTGAVYATATDFPRLVRWVVVSHDAGATFGPPRAIDSNDYPQAQGEQAGDYVPAAANGAIAFAYVASAAPGGGCPCGIFETSRDDGLTWTRHPTPFPANWVAADSGHPGRFAIMSGQGVTATPAYQGAIGVSTTDDSGKTWSKPVLLGQPAVHPEIQPWIGYSPTGVLGVGYKILDSGLISQPEFFADALSGNLSSAYDFWTAVSFDNGMRFSQPLRVSNAASPPGNVSGNDDFSNVALDDSYLYAAWGDRRTSPTNPAPGPVGVYFARVPLQAYSTYPASNGPPQPFAPVVVVGGGAGVSGGPASAVPGAANATSLAIVGTGAHACVSTKRLIFRINRVPHGRIVSVRVTVNGRHVLTKTGQNVKRVSFARPPGSHLAIVIVTINNHGGGVVTTRTFRGCTRTKVSGTVLGHSPRSDRPGPKTDGLVISRQRG